MVNLIILFAHLLKDILLNTNPFPKTTKMYGKIQEWYLTVLQQALMRLC